MLCCYGTIATIEKEIFIVALRKALGEGFFYIYIYIYIFFFFLTFGSFWRVINVLVIILHCIALKR